MTQRARTAILERLRAARPTSRLPRPDERPFLTQTRRSNDECLNRFEQEARALGVAVYVESSAADVRARVAELTDGLLVLTWNPEHLGFGIGNVFSDALRGSAPIEQQALAAVGVTGCDAAIAETGTLAMIGAPGRSRTVSLLPPLHVAVVARHQLCYTMAEFFEAHRDQLAAAASCTFITGPSRTADIELTLTLGIHGPGRVTIIVGP